jgi:nucleoside-diphosphate-sugar epimerase
MCCVLQGVANMIAAAKETGGVKHLVLVSSMLTDPANR